jgi:hypothetical protein
MRSILLTSHRMPHEASSSNSMMAQRAANHTASAPPNNRPIQPNRTQSIPTQLIPIPRVRLVTRTRRSGSERHSPVSHSAILCRTASGVGAQKRRVASRGMYIHIISHFCLLRYIHTIICNTDGPRNERIPMIYGVSHHAMSPPGLADRRSGECSGRKPTCVPACPTPLPFHAAGTVGSRLARMHVVESLGVGSRQVMRRGSIGCGYVCIWGA